MRFLDLKRHKRTCSWRTIECTMHCGMKITIQESFRHFTRECVCRRIPCPNLCSRMVVVQNMKQHLLEVCPNRPNPCEFCGQSMVYNNYVKHRKVCDQRLELCPAKCGETINIQQMKQHLALFCNNRFIDCSQGCGKKVRLCDELVHQGTDCDNRLVLCPLKCVISEEVPLQLRERRLVAANLLELHMKYDCPEREHSCHVCHKSVKFKLNKFHHDSECDEVLTQ
jgi:hypothetical protein